MVFSDVKYKKFNSQRRFGVELEMGRAYIDGELSKNFTKSKVKSIISNESSRNILVTKYQLSQEFYGWHVKDDSTCGHFGKLGPKGIEVASFVAKGITELQHIANVAELLEQSGCTTNTNCGFHIHAEAKDLTPYNVGILLAYWIKMEKILSLSLPFWRYNNPYCRNILDGKNIDRNKKYGALALYSQLRPTNISYYENDDRRVNLNLVNYTRAEYFETANRKTLELRWPEGTLNPRNIKCWVRLFLSFIDNCKDKPMPDNLQDASLEETLSYLGLAHQDQSFVIFSEGLHDTKTWFLERILLNTAPSNKKNDPVKKAKKILNEMWSPVKKYS